MMNFVESLYEFGGNADREEFWNMFFGYGFKVVPTLKLFQIAFGDDEGGSYFNQMKNLMDNFENAAGMCARFESGKERMLWEINNPEEYKKECASPKKDKNLEIFELFFNKEHVDNYKELTKRSDEERDIIKNMIAKFGVKKTEQELYSTFNKYLRELLVELGIRRIDDMTSELTPSICYCDIDDSDNCDVEKDDDLRRIACFVKKDILPQMTSED